MAVRAAMMFLSLLASLPNPASTSAPVAAQGADRVQPDPEHAGERLQRLLYPGFAGLERQSPTGDAAAAYAAPLGSSARRFMQSASVQGCNPLPAGICGAVHDITLMTVSQATVTWDTSISLEEGGSCLRTTCFIPSLDECCRIATENGVRPTGRDGQRYVDDDDWGTASPEEKNWWNDHACSNKVGGYREGYSEGYCGTEDRRHDAFDNPISRFDFDLTTAHTAFGAMVPRGGSIEIDLLNSPVGNPVMEMRWGGGCPGVVSMEQHSSSAKQCVSLQSPTDILLSWTNDQTAAQPVYFVVVLKDSATTVDLRWRYMSTSFITTMPDCNGPGLNSATNAIISSKQSGFSFAINDFMPLDSS